MKHNFIWLCLLILYFFLSYSFLFLFYPFSLSLVRWGSLECRGRESHIEVPPTLYYLSNYWPKQKTLDFQISFPVWGRERKRVKNAIVRGLDSKVHQWKVPILWHCSLRRGPDFMDFLCSLHSVVKSIWIRSGASTPITIIWKFLLSWFTRLVGNRNFSFFSPWLFVTWKSWENENVLIHELTWLMQLLTDFVSPWRFLLDKWIL